MADWMSGWPIMKFFTNLGTRPLMDRPSMSCNTSTGAGSANADYRDAHGLGDFLGQFAGHAFQQNHRCASLFSAMASARICRA